MRPINAKEAFLGTEEEPQIREKIKKAKWVASPEMAFCRDTKVKFLAVVRGNAQVGGNRVYQVEDIRLVTILRVYAESSGSWITFYQI